jgi:hypothetical protein
MRGPDENPWLRFDEALERAPARPGIYEIKNGQELLKVGIAANLRKRLRQHAKSSQKRLKGRMPPPWSDPQHVASKGSILAKHLYFDHAITRAYDLRSEADRVAFLKEQCWVRITMTRSKEAARHTEKSLEAAGTFRYVGTVIRRDADGTVIE